MRILLANDDGIYAFGLRELARQLVAAGHTVVVTAPAEERSACGHAITMGKTGIEYDRMDFDGIEAYRVFGTPADCVKFGCLYLGLSPELVIAGINHGHNIGSEIMCSGTVAAASEGAYLGFRSVAISCFVREDTDLLSRCARFAVKYLDELRTVEIPPFSILNINYPESEACGTVYTRMGVQLFDDRYVEENEKYYLRGNKIGYPQNPDDCDVNWIKKNYITVTPLKADRTDYVLLSRLKGVKS